MDDPIQDLYRHFTQIEIEESVLYRKVFQEQDAFQAHIDATLQREYDTSIVIQFRPHFPTIREVSACQNLLPLLQYIAMMERTGRPDREVIPFRLVRTVERDWFFEACAALGGIAQVILLLLEIQRRQAQSGTQRRTRRRSTVPLESGIVMQGNIVEGNEIVGQGAVEDIEDTIEYYNRNLSTIELYNRNGEVVRLHSETGTRIDNRV